MLEDRLAPANASPFIYNAPAPSALTLKYDGSSELEIVSASATVLAEQALAATSNVVVTGFSSGTNTLTVDYGNAFSVPVTYNGAPAGANALSVTGGSFAQVTDQVLGSNSGTLTLINSSNVSESVTYSQVQSVADATNATARIFDATPITGPEQIRLTTHNDSSGQQTIDSNATGEFAPYTFSDPASLLTINGGSGGASFVFDGLDSAYTTTGPTIDINGGTGNDNLFVGSGVAPFRGVFSGMAGVNTVVYGTSAPFASLTTTNVQTTIAGQSVSIDGGLNYLGGLIQGQATLSLSVQSSLSATTSTGTNLTGADLYTFSVSFSAGQQLTIGSASAGVTITSGSATLAILTAGSATYVGFSATSVGGSIGLPDVTGTVSNVQVAVNAGPKTGDTSSGLNWSSLSAQDPFATSFTTQPSTQISGVVSGLSLFDVFDVSADFAFAVQPANVQLSPGNDLTGAALITVAFNTLVEGSTSGGAAISIAALEPPTPTSGTDSRYWIAVDASGLSASLALGTRVTAVVSAVGVQVNQAGGNINGVQATPIDWATSVALNGDASFGDPVMAGTQTINFAGPTDSIGGSLTDLSLFDVISGSATFSLSLATVDVALTGGQTLAGANLITILLSNLNASSGAIGLKLAGAELGIALLIAPTPAVGTDDRSWIAIDGLNLASASLSLGGVSATVSGLGVAINESFGSATIGPNTTRGPPLDWSADLSFDGGQTYGGASNLADPGGVAGLTIAYSTTQFGVSGTLTNLNVYNVLDGSATFAVNESTVGVSLGNNNTLTGASLLTFGLTGLNGSIASGSFGISVSGGSLGVALLQPPAPATGTDSRYWLAVVGSGLGGTLALGSGISASVVNASLAINQAGGTDPNQVAATPLNWTTALDLDDDGLYGTAADQLVVPPTSLAITATSGQLLVTGSLASLDIDNLLNASASFALSESTVNALVGNTTLTSASLLTIGLSGLTASTGSNGFGIAVTGGTLGVALLEPASRSDSRYWLSVVGTGIAGTLALSSSVSAAVQDGTVAINQAGGVDASNNPATPLNWTSDLDLNGDGQFGTGADQVNVLSSLTPAASLPITATSGEFVVSGSLTNLNIDNVLGGSASFALSQSAVSPIVGGTTLTNGNLITFGLSDLQATAGVGAFGISVSGGELGLALLEASPGTVGADSRYWVAVTSSDLGGRLELGGDVSASVQNVAVSINQAGGTDASHQAATPLDWDSVFSPLIDPGMDLPTPPTTSLAITATGAEESVSGTLASLDIFGILTGSANFALTDATVSPVVGGALLTDATLITLGLSDLQATAGTGGFGVAINGGDLGITLLEAPTPATGMDNRYWLAVIGSALAGELSLGPNLSASVAGLSVAINVAGGTNGTPATALDWATTFSPQVVPIAGLTVTLASPEFSVAGALTNLNIDNTLELSASFAVSEQTVSAVLSTGTLTGASLLTIGLSGVTAATSSSSGVAVSGGTFGLAILEPAVPASGTDSRYWVAVVASGLGGSLSLAGVSGTITGGTVAISEQGGTDANGNAAASVDWTTAFGMPVTPIAGLTVQSTGPQVSVGGTLTNLNIDNVVQASATFALAESTVTATLGTNATLTGASLLTLGLSGLTASVGSGNFGVSLTGGTLGVALLRPAAPATGTDSRYWLAVVGSGLAGTLSLGTNVSASVSGGSVAINQAGGTDPGNNAAAPLDWATAFGTAVSPITGVTIQLATGGLLVSGSLSSLNIFNVLTASASFAIGESTVDVAVGSTTLTGATLLTVALSNLTASVGTGQYGVAVTSGNLGIAVVEAPSQGGTDTRAWIAVTGSGLSGTLTLGSDVSATVTGLTIAINAASGHDATQQPATPLNWKASVSLDGGVTFGATVDPGANIAPAGSVSLPITATGGEVALSGVLAGLNIFNVITGSASFALSDSTVSPVVGGVTLAGATLLTIGLGNLQATAGTGAYGVAITGGNLGIAVLEAPQPQSGQDTRDWVAVTGNALAGSLALGTSISATVSGLAVSINTATGLDSTNHAATPLDWATVFSPAIDPGANIAPTGSVSLPITATAGSFLLSGSLTSLNIFNVITGSASFALSDSTVSPVVGGVTLAGATLLTIGLGNLQATAGSGAFGVAITGGNLGIAVLEAPQPQSGQDTRDWVAVTGNALAGSLALGTSISATVSGLAVSINTATGLDSSNHAATPLDWATVFSPAIDPGANIAPTGSVSLPITATAGSFLLSGSLTSLNIFNVITGRANFALSETTADVSFNGTGPANVTGATLLTVALSSLQASVSGGSFGVAITGGDLGLAVIEAPQPTTGSDSRYWLAVVGNGLAGSLNLGTQVSATVSGLAVMINTAGGTDVNGLASSPLDWTHDISLDAGAHYGATVDPGSNLTGTPPPSLAIAATTGGIALSGKLASLNVFNLITGSANFALSEATVGVEVGTTKLTGATLLTLALSNLAVSAGTSGFGVNVSAGDLGIALVEAPTPASGTDNRYWIAVDAVNLAATLSLGTNISASVASITAAINQAGGSMTAGAAGSTPVPATALNWAADLNLNGDTVFGGPGDTVDPGALLSSSASPLTMPITFTTSTLALSGSLTNLNIFNIISGTANFALSQTLVNAQIGASTLTGATLLTVGLSDLAASANSSGFGVAVTSGDIGIAVLEAPSAGGTDTRYWLAVDGTNLAATLNLGSAVTATVSSITVQINQAGGVDASMNPATPIDWSADLDLNGDGVYGGYGDIVDPGANLPTPVAMPILFPAVALVGFGGDLSNLNIDNQVTGSADFAITSTTVDVTGHATLTNARLVTVALTNLQAGKLGLQVSGGALGIAAIEPAMPTSTDTRYWLAVTGINLTATLNLGSDITLTSGTANLQINTAGGSDTSGPASALDWATDISLDGGTHYSATVNPGANLAPPVALGITYTGAESGLQTNQANGGTGAQINIDNLIVGSANFALNTATVNVSFDGGTTVGLTGATLYTLALSNLQVSAGTGSFGLTIGGGGDIGIAAILPAAAANDSRYWVAVTGSGLGGSLNFGGVSATVSGLSVMLNLAGGTNPSNVAAVPLNWAADIELQNTTSFAYQVDPGANLSPTVTGLAITYATGPLTALAGSLTNLNIFDLIEGSAHFAISESTVNVAFNGASPANLTNATLVQIGLSGLTTSVGSGNFGIAVTGGSLGIAVVEPSDPGVDGRRWVAVYGTGLAAGLNLGSAVTATIDNVNVLINQASGAAADNTPAAPLNWSADLELAGTTTFGLAVNPGALLPVSSNLTIPFTGGQIALAGSLTNLSVFNVLNASADFALSKSSVNVSLGAGNTLTGATLFTLALDNIQAGASAGGFGVAVTGGTLGLAVLEPATPTGGGTDSRIWTAVTGSNLSANLTLTSNVTAAVAGMSIAINQASGSFTAATQGATPIPATPLNWTTALDLNDDGQFGTRADQVDPGASLPSPTSLAISFTRGQLVLAGTLTSLNIFNVITASASFALSESTVGVSLAGGTTLAGATLITLALDNLSAGVGSGGFGVAVTGGTVGLALLEPAMPVNNSPYWVAVTGSNLSASLTLSPNVTAAVSNLTVSINQAASGTSPLDWATDLDLNGDGSYGTPSDQVDPGANLPTPVSLPITFTAACWR